MQTLGQTAHFNIQYDETLLGSDGKPNAVSRAQRVLGVCEPEFGLLASWYSDRWIWTRQSHHSSIGCRLCSGWGKQQRVQGKQHDHQDRQPDGKRECNCCGSKQLHVFCG